MECLLTNAAARESLRSLTLSAAENGTNCNGFAKLVYQDGENRRRTFFVSKMAVSLLQAGGENRLDEDNYHSAASKCLVLNRAFFDKLVQKGSRRF